MNATPYEYSAKIAIAFETAHGPVNVRQCCGDYIIARHPVDIPPGEATLTVFVDDVPDPCRVYMPEGIRAGEEVHRIMIIEPRPY